MYSYCWDPEEDKSLSSTLLKYYICDAAFVLPLATLTLLLVALTLLLVALTLLVITITLLLGHRYHSLRYLSCLVIAITLSVVTITLSVIAITLSVVTITLSVIAITLSVIAHCSHSLGHRSSSASLVTIAKMFLLANVPCSASMEDYKHVFGERFFQSGQAKVFLLSNGLP
ncbi:hypothetical protein EV424DRAFT_1534475 [Suillus variegatus]|nr:hypothetical protein EV424DRAFT_1534475 [Suillus variegatus]